MLGIYAGNKILFELLFIISISVKKIVSIVSQGNNLKIKNIYKIVFKTTVLNISNETLYLIVKCFPNNPNEPYIWNNIYLSNIYSTTFCMQVSLYLFIFFS